ncbi:MAG: thiamine pyrophosphate-dependent enzyme [Armatimonadetes bacterium]|nr:thiamine pyrophosphate-dependent enzyme [Armatimonadota bacterium]
MGRTYPNHEIEQLKKGEGEVIWADGCLAILKALLESGVAYLGGYPGAPVSNLTDAFLDAEERILKPMGIFVANNVNEAAAAAMLRFSVNAPLRGAVAWKVVGTNVASDALSHVCSSGVQGGVVVFVGEDYAASSTLVVQKTLPYGYNFGAPVLDPKADLNHVAQLTRLAFELSETCRMPVLFLVRTRVGNMKGWLRVKDNQQPNFNLHHRLTELQRIPDRFPIPPFTQQHEREKWRERVPLAKSFIRQNGINERYDNGGRKGIVVHGLLFNVALRALMRLGEVEFRRELVATHAQIANSPKDAISLLQHPVPASQSPISDLQSQVTDFQSPVPNNQSLSFGIPLLSLHALFPIVEDELAEFLEGKDEVLIVEEGEPSFLEREIRAIAQQIGWTGRIVRSEFLPTTGELTTDIVTDGLTKFLRNSTAFASVPRPSPPDHSDLPVVPRFPNFCTGCPERPAVLTGLKVFRDLHPDARFEVVLDIGCYIMGIYYLRDLVSPVTGMGTCLASSLASSFLSQERTIYIVGDGTFWAQALTTSISNALYHKQDCVVLILENFWTAMTGHQPNPSTQIGEHAGNLDIEATLKGMGAKWVKVVNPYEVGEVVKLLEEAWQLSEIGPRFLIVRGECMLERSRRERKEREQLRVVGKRVTEAHFGVDPLVCVGDHSCLHYNNCPSLSVRPSPNPLKRDMIVKAEQTCVACGLCGSVAHAAKLCPSFYRVEQVHNPSWWERLQFRLRRKLLGV